MNLQDFAFYKKNRYMPFPKTLQIEITRECPFNCPQCYKSEITKKEQDLQYLKQIITETYNNGTRLYILNGGEPLLYSSIVELLFYLKEFPDISINCFSSGFQLSDEIIRILKSFPNFNFSLSLNGSTEEVNQLSRQGYGITMNAMKKLMKANCQFDINWVARRDNIDDFQKLLDLSKRYHARSVSITVNKLNGSTRKVDSELTKNDLSLLANIINERQDVIIRVESCYPQLTAHIRKLNKFDGCYAGILNCFVTIERTFAPCTYLIDYNEDYESIIDYWNNSKILKQLRNREKCTKCELECNFCFATSYKTYTDFNSQFDECNMITDPLSQH